jgi:hypothetical protein
LMGQDGGVKVADFGLAKQVEGDRSTFMTQTGTLAGTMYYMAPEQAEGLEVTMAADIYAFGVIWHELLTGKKPGRRLKVEEQRPDCPKGWGNLIEQCLDDEPEDRPGLNSIKQAFDTEVFEAAADRAAADRAAADRAAADRAAADRAAADRTATDRTATGRAANDFAAGVKAAADEFADVENTRVDKETPKPKLGAVGEEAPAEYSTEPESKGVRGKVLLAVGGIVGLSVFLGVNLYLLISKQDNAVQLVHEISELQGELRLVYETSQKLALWEDHLFYRRKPLEVLDGISKTMPEEIIMDSISYSESIGSGDGNLTIIRGQCSQDDTQKLQVYSDQLAKLTALDSRTDERKPLFSLVAPPNTVEREGGYLNWHIICKVGQRKTALLENSASSGQHLTPAQYVWQPSLGLLFNSQKKLNLNKAITHLKIKKTHLQDELKSMPQLATLKSELKTLQGTMYASDSELLRKVHSQAGQSGITLSRSVLTRSQPVAGLVVHKRVIRFQSDAIKLVDFLKNMSGEQSMIRVIDMRIMPTSGSRQLTVDLTFAGFFPK